MEDFFARPDLLSRERIAALSVKSDVKSLAHLALHVAALGVTGSLLWLASGAWWLVPAMILHGVVIAFLFCAHHELIHRTVFRRKGVNDALAFITGWLVFYPAYYFRLFHFAHHRHTQDPALDPELSSPPPATRAAYLWWGLGLPYLRRRFGTSLKHAVTGRAEQNFVRAGDQAACVAEARWMWAGYVTVIAASVALGSWAALQYWLLPILLGQPFLRLYLMAEHTRCASSDDMIANTRTVLSNPIVRALAWNMTYHTEHHVFPSVPFHALPTLHEDMKEHLKNSAPGYLAVHRELWRALSTPEKEMVHG